MPDPLVMLYSRNLSVACATSGSTTWVHVVFGSASILAALRDLRDGDHRALLAVGGEDAVGLRHPLRGDVGGAEDVLRRVLADRLPVGLVQTEAQHGVAHLAAAELLARARRRPCWSTAPSPS